VAYTVSEEERLQALQGVQRSDVEIRLHGNAVQRRRHRRQLAMILLEGEAWPRLHLQLCTCWTLSDHA